MKVAFFSTKSYDKEYFEKINVNFKHELVFFESSLRAKSVKLAENSDAVCIFVNDVISKEVINSLADLKVKVIALRCAGFNNVDIESADQRNLKILRVPAYSPNGVAEHAVALILTLNRKTHKAYNRVREGNFSIERLTGFELFGRTVGVIGTGKIGAAFGSIMTGFGCKVVAYDLHPNKELEEKGVQYVTLNELLRVSDIISLHCPLTPETSQIINEKSIGVMKKGAMLINTSRGKLIDTDAVIDALRSGQLGYVGIDVYEQEESIFFKDLSEIIIPDDKITLLMSFPNVLVTAHQAFFTDKALVQIAQTTLQNLSDFEKGVINIENQVSKLMLK